LGRDLIDVLKFKEFENKYDGTHDFGTIKYLNTHSLVNQKTGEMHKVQTNDSVINDKNGNNVGMVIVLRREKVDDNLSASILSLVNS